MSLINKMLIDLETRQDGGNKPRPVFEDLRPSLGMGAQRRSPRLAIVALVFVASSATAWFIWSHREQPSVPALVPPVAQTAVVETPKAPVPPAPVTIVASAPSSPPAASVVGSNTAKNEAAPAPTTPVTATTTAMPKVETPSPALPVESTSAIEVTPAPLPEKAKPVSKPKIKNATARVAALAPVATPLATTSSDAVVIDRKAHVFTAEEQAEQSYREGVAALKKDRRANAEQAMRTALTKHATHIKARELLAGLYIDARRWNDASALLTDGIAAVPQHYAFAQLAARVYVEQGQNDKALAVLQAAHARATGDADFLGFEATLMQRAGRYADAVSSYRAALALQPYEPRLWAGLGISYEAQQQWHEAENAYVHVRDLGGNSAPALARYANERLVIVKGKL